MAMAMSAADALVAIHVHPCHYYDKIQKEFILISKRACHSLREAVCSMTRFLVGGQRYSAAVAFPPSQRSITIDV
jgi:hypothetical protein